MRLYQVALLCMVVGLGACEIERVPDFDDDGGMGAEELLRPARDEDNIQQLLDQYTTVRLSTDLPLSEADRQLIPILIDVADLMDEVFWHQAYGNRDSLLARIADRRTAEFVMINYGPWDRLRGDEPFVSGVRTKPLGANFYPPDVTREDIQAAADRDPDILELYTLVRRDSLGNLVAIPYSERYAEVHQQAATLLNEAAELATDPGLSRYLSLRAEALLTDEYQQSDRAWLDMRDNTIDFIVGPIETYEDQLFGAKAAHEAYVLVKDREWSERLSRYAAMLPDLQRGLPVPDRYKRGTPGADSDLGAYDVIYYAGDANAGSKTIAVNLPNDEEVQREKGTRRLQLKNAMQAKFDHILLPIANQLLVREQRPNVRFDAFFENVMFHEVAHGLGIWTVVDGTGRTVREALRDHASALEEGKADVLGLYMIQELSESGELGAEHQMMDNYVTFLASIFRSIRFGSASAHGVANLIRFNYFQQYGAFTRDADGRYRVNAGPMRSAVNSLSQRILTMQGDGDYEAVAAFVNEYGRVGPRLQEDLDRLGDAQIPVDVVFDQGLSELGY